MSQSANVRSIDALKDFKIAMISFAEDARTALTSVEMEVRRTRGWLEREQLAYWNAQVKRRDQEVAIARSELHRRRLSQANSDAMSDTDQKEALKLAQKRLAEAEEKVVKVKRWIPILEQAISQYHSHSQPLGDRLSGAYENSLAVLERMILSLESYLALAPPPAPTRAPEGTSSASASAGTGSATSRVGADGEPVPESETEAAAEAEVEPAEAVAAGRNKADEGGNRRELAAKRGTGTFLEVEAMSAGSGRLSHAIKKLREHWDIATEKWDDRVAQEFEKNHLNPVEQQSEAAISGMEKINEVMIRVRQDCS